MSASTPFTATLYCSIHEKFFLESLQAWCSLQSTHLPSPRGNREVIEASCDECMMLARRAFKAQFPRPLHPEDVEGPRARRGLYASSLSPFVYHG